MALIHGSKLNQLQRRAVLAVFVHRWTHENARRLFGNQPTIPRVSDAEWITAHAFYMTRAGQLDHRYGHCEPALMAEPA